MGRSEDRKLKRLLRVGSTYAVTIPASWVKEMDCKYVWLVKRSRRELVITPAEVT